uniref:Ribosomal protein S4 n=1 Tax=Aureoumbra lagunensis TaxID=44058 RepID=A0A7U0KST8_9STRA|nr:ribosomal protein S4 [Aureoumbra lagunensis]QQW50399.1 ribosomal protein S4 [Aureoumbra lagunensis]
MKKRLSYKPRLKKSFFQKELNAFVSKDFSKLKKIKWRFFAKKPIFFETFFRNDVTFISKNLFDIKKGFLKGLQNNQKFLSTFACLSRKNLRQLNSKSLKKYSGFEKNNFYASLNCRLDVLLFALNFTKTIFQSKWVISKGFVFVNQRKIVSNSFVLKHGDLIELKLPRNLQERFFSIQTFNLSENCFEICYESLSCIFLNVSQNSLFNYRTFFDLDEFRHFN